MRHSLLMLILAGNPFQYPRHATEREIQVLIDQWRVEFKNDCNLFLKDEPRDPDRCRLRKTVRL